MVDQTLDYQFQNVLPTNFVGNLFHRIPIFHRKDIRNDDWGRICLRQAHQNKISDTLHHSGKDDQLKFFNGNIRQL